MALLKNRYKPRVLVTGSRGFIGTNLVKKLNDTFNLIPLELVSNQKINILERNQLHSINDIDAIIHLASKTSIVKSIINPYETYLTNIMGTLNVLDFAKQNNIHKIINFSTYVYGKPLKLPIDESHPVNPHSPYTKSKVIAEKLCEYYALDYGIDIVTLRPFYIYGPSSSKLSLIPSIINQVNHGGKVTLSGKNTKRDFLFVDDLISLIGNIILNFPKGLNTYNVGSGRSFSLEEVVEIIKEILQIEICIEYDASIRPNDISEMVANINSLNKLFSWKPKIDLRTGIRRIVEVNNT